MAAEENARKATLLDSKFSDGWLALGTSQFYGDREPKAINSLNVALRLNPKNAHITYMLGRCYYYLGGNDEDIKKYKTKALEYFKQTLRLKSTYVQARFMEGCCFLDLDMPDVARDSFLVALRGQPEHAETFFRLGLCAIRTRRYVEAERRFRETLRFAPKHADAHLYLADLFLKHLPDPAQAKLHYKRFLSLAPRDHAERPRVENILKKSNDKDN
jgi:tetratricopeptide (TPR) repeat protein